MNALLHQKKEEEYQRGKQVRQQVEEKKTALRENEVQNLEVSALCVSMKCVTEAAFTVIQEHSYGFITMENLDEKIQEAIDYEVDYNFALTTDGKKITS